MIVRRAKRRVEHLIGNGYEKIRCSICKTVWLENNWSEYTFDYCQHLRFKYLSEPYDQWEFFGDWDYKKFQKNLIKAEKSALDSDEGFNISDYLSSMSNPDIDEVIYWFEDDDMGSPGTTYFGFKKSDISSKVNKNIEYTPPYRF